MSLISSNMPPLGMTAPSFQLLDTVTGEFQSLEQLAGEQATLVMFISNHCPYVKHIREELVRLADEYHQKGVSLIGISSNDVENYPEDSPEMMKEEARKHGYTFPYLYDESQEVAKAYDAACTPDFYLFDKDLKLAYRGRLDDSSPGNGKPLTGKDIRQSLEYILNGNPVSAEQIPSMGCNIKWKS
jgi:peroxiredoxin